MSKKDIAKAINVDLSTIYRELKRNSGSRNHYNWETAEANARRKKRRTPGNRRISQEVREEALRLLKEKQWSPEQISGYLVKEGKRISTESIYRIIRKDKKERQSPHGHPSRSRRFQLQSERRCPTEFSPPLF